jgi:hypothetical protein
MDSLVEPDETPAELLGDALQLLYEGLEARALRSGLS